MQKLAVLLKARLFDLDQSSAHHRPQQRLILVAAQSTDRFEFPLQRSRRNVSCLSQLVYYRLDNDSLGRAGVPETAQHRACRVTEIADSAKVAGIFHISEMPHKLRHPARARIGNPNHVFKLLGTVLGLHCVSFLPSGSTPGYRSSEIDASATVNL